jgi:hypothetical protein
MTRRWSDQFQDTNNACIIIVIICCKIKDRALCPTHAPPLRRSANFGDNPKVPLKYFTWKRFFSKKSPPTNHPRRSYRFSSTQRCGKCKETVSAATKCRLPNIAHVRQQKFLDWGRFECCHHQLTVVLCSSMTDISWKSIVVDSFHSERKKFAYNDCTACTITQTDQRVCVFTNICKVTQCYVSLG